MIQNAHPENEKREGSKEYRFQHLQRHIYSNQLESELDKRFPRELLHCSLLAHKTNTNTQRRYLQMNKIQIQKKYANTCLHILSLSVAELSKQTIIAASAPFLPELVSVMGFPFKLILSLTIRQIKIQCKNTNKKYGEGK